MCLPELGSIEKVEDIRTVWPSESSCFTPWLADNISLLSQALGEDLEKGDTEEQVGSLFADILTKDSRGRPVVIENQLEATDHDHLARLLIYAAGSDAQIVIWVATEFKDEHRCVIDYLNNRTNGNIDFYGVEVRVIRIGASLPAPEFRVVAGPSTCPKEVSRPELVSKKLQFYQPLVDILGKLGLTYSTRAKEWNPVPSGFRGINYYPWIPGKRAKRVEVYLEIDGADSAINERVFSSLEADKANIGTELGQELEWKRQGKLQIILRGEEASIDDLPEKLDKIRNWLLEHLQKLMQVFQPRLKQIMRQSPPEEG